MKKNFYFCTLLLMCASLFFVSCGDDSEDEPENKTEEPIITPKDFALSSLFVQFFDVDMNIQTTPFTSLKKIMANYYTLTYDEDNYFYIEASKNKGLKNYTYLGKPFDRFFIGDYEYFLAISYEFDIQYSEDPYPYLDRVVNDFAKMGIEISYEKQDNKYIKAEGETTVGNKTYKFFLWDTGAYWQIHLSLDINNK